MSRIWVWKTLKKLENEKTIKLNSIISGKTNPFKVEINWENPIIEKFLSLYLLHEASKKEHWNIDSKNIEEVADFLILHEPLEIKKKKESTINLLSLISQKRRFLKIKPPSTLSNPNIKINYLTFTEDTLLDKLKNENPLIIEIIKNGTVLSGQDNFISFIKKLHV